MSNKSRKKPSDRGPKYYVAPVQLLNLESWLNDLSGTMLALAAWGQVHGGGVSGDLESLLRDKLRINAKIEMSFQFSQPVASLALQRWDETMAAMRNRMNGPPPSLQPSMPASLADMPAAGPGLSDMQPYDLQAAQSGLSESVLNPEAHALAAIIKAEGTAGYPEGYTASYEGLFDHRSWRIHVQGPEGEPGVIRFSMASSLELLVDTIYETAVVMASKTEDYDRTTAIVGEPQELPEFSSLPETGAQDSDSG